MLFSGGVLDETETQLLELGVQVRQKRLAEIPPTVLPLTSEELLENVSWMKGLF